MSLKLFHLLFVSVSTLLALFVGLWALNAYRETGTVSWLALTALAFAGGAGLVVYGSRFLQKTRKLGLAGALVAGSLALPADAAACAVCLGNTTSTMRTGMNMGILALLAITGLVLVCFAAFFIYLARRAKAFGADTAPFRVPSHEGSH